MNLILAVLQHEAESPGVFSFAINVSFWTVVIFVLLLFLLTKFAFPPILGYAAAREARIQEALDSARRDREEAQRLIEEQRIALAKAREEGQHLIGESQKAAERVRRELLEKARAEQDEMLQRAKAEIGEERAKAIDSLRREAVDLAVAAASRLVERKLDTQEDRRIVSEFLSQVKSSGVVSAN